VPRFERHPRRLGIARAGDTWDARFVATREVDPADEERGDERDEDLEPDATVERPIGPYKRVQRSVEACLVGPAIVDGERVDILVLLVVEAVGARDVVRAGFVGWPPDALNPYRPLAQATLAS
jgi:hypothetical protein